MTDRQNSPKLSECFGKFRKQWVIESIAKAVLLRIFTLTSFWRDSVGFENIGTEASSMIGMCPWQVDLVFERAIAQEHFFLNFLAFKQSVT